MLAECGEWRKRVRFLFGNERWKRFLVSVVMCADVRVEVTTEILRRILIGCAQDDRLRVADERTKTRRGVNDNLNDGKLSCRSVLAGIRLNPHPLKTEGATPKGQDAVILRTAGTAVPCPYGWSLIVVTIGGG